jgi:hypothetical protein
VRRRRAALGAVAAVTVVVVAVIASSGGGRGSPTDRTSAVHPAAQHVSTPVRRVVKDGPRGTESVPILMYHVILPAPAGAPFPGLYVPQAEFAAQMHALAPVLRAMGWLGVENLQLSGLPPSQGGLSQREVRALVRAGWELDTQGYNHADLITLDASELRFQVAVARERIRALYHVAANWFCYPSGHYDASVIDAVRAAGYRGSTTVTPGWASPAEDPYRLPRLRVLAGTSPGALLSELAAIRTDPPPGPSYS